MTPDPDVVKHVKEILSCSQDVATEAAIHGNNNKEGAVNWVLNHREDSNIDNFGSGVGGAIGGPRLASAAKGTAKNAQLENAACVIDPTTWQQRSNSLYCWLI